ncbi:twin-arginine translocase subunit TatC [Pseudobdellovibrio exovorus]|uniref:Sec-independent protein translocase protein TatC n=1 Tax=Pseudobdellovibrio exovorus JSS TaxID=1184267 RepID=M4VFF3_9BACT|nr:twin-arginine translocase subunit TatC [Pseudobdellovibrio exovorus]AGH96781.1 sec-independent protein translocase protein [Pseudobdellovibrio exovorus JSS]
MNHLDNQNESQDRNMSLIDHLSELRVRMTRSAYAIFIGMLICWGFSEQVFDFIRTPIQQYLPTGGLVFTAPMDKFMAHIKISFVVGLLLSAPFWLYQIWSFVAPALYRREKRLATGFIFFGTLQFVMGLAFSYYIVFPMAFKFLMGFGGSIDKPMITIEHYLGFVTRTAIVFGLCFQLPVLISFLGMLGLVSQRFLKEKRRFAVVGIAAVSAIAAPPDALSMILLLVPMWALYEVSIVVVGIFERKKAAEEAENAEKSLVPKA